jgi:hypothetical protein
MRFDKVTPEQRARFEAHCADQNARFPLPATCMVCEKVLMDMSAPGKLQLAAGAVVVPFFGYFCSQACADTLERDYGILFKRNATGKVSYE